MEQGCDVWSSTDSAESELNSDPFEFWDVEEHETSRIPNAPYVLLAPVFKDRDCELLEYEQRPR